MEMISKNVIAQLCKTYGCNVEGIRIFYLQRCLLNWETGEEDGYEYLYRVVIKDEFCNVNDLRIFISKFISDFDVEVSTVLDDSLEWVECE
jgi:hypothetical protein